MRITGRTRDRRAGSRAPGAPQGLTWDGQAANIARPFADLGPGDLFGSHAVLSGRARHSYRAAEESLCYTIPAAVF